MGRLGFRRKSSGCLVFGPPVSRFPLGNLGSAGSVMGSPHSCGGAVFGYRIVNDATPAHNAPRLLNTCTLFLLRCESEDSSRLSIRPLAEVRQDHRDSRDATLGSPSTPPTSAHAACPTIAPSPPPHRCAHALPCVSTLCSHYQS